MIARLAVLAAIASALVAPNAAEAAIPGKPVRVVKGTQVAAGPTLAGPRVVWARNAGLGVKVGTATRRTKGTLFALRQPRDSEQRRITDLAASPDRVAYAAVDYYYDLRDLFAGGYDYGTHRFGTRRPHASLGYCLFFENPCFGGYLTFTRGMEVDGEVAAWGPFQDGSPDQLSRAILVRNFTPAKGEEPDAIVRGRGMSNLRLAGPYLAYERELRGAPEKVVVVNWQTGAVLRELTVPAVRDDESRFDAPSFSFDVDANGNVAAAWRAKGRTTRYGVFDASGRLTTFSRRSSGSSHGAIWLRSGRVAFGRASGKRRLWEVTDLRGRLIASMRPRSGARLTDFDGDCLAWRESQRHIYVAAVAARVTPGSVCR